MAQTPPGQEEDNSADLSRRTFLQFAGFGALMAALGGTALGGLRYMFPNVLYEPSNFLKIGEPGSVPMNTVTFFDEKKVFVRRTTEGFQAISAICAHLGCTVNWMSGQSEYYCPCHGSVYSADGERIAGPAPRGLETYAMRIANDGNLVIDLSRPVPRVERFDFNA